MDRHVLTLGDNSRLVSDFALRIKKNAANLRGRRHSVYTAKERKMFASLMAMIFGGPETNYYEWG